MISPERKPSRSRVFGGLELLESSLAHVGMEVFQSNDYAVRSTQAEFSSKSVAL